MNMKRLIPLVIIVVVLASALTFGVWSIRSHGNNAAAVPSEPQVVESKPGAGAEPPHVKGPEDATVVLEEFGDFECPACAKFEPVWQSLESDYGKKIRFIFRHFPLPLHKRALLAAYASEAAGVQGKFWEMHDKLFEHREQWSKSTEPEALSLTESFAKDLGLDVERFKQDRQSDPVRNRVKLDFQRGKSLKIKATPTLYLNGVEVPYSQIKTVAEFRKILDDSLNNQTAKR
jgi:protein-disulfide isomerase